MTVKRFRKIENLMVDTDSTIDELVTRGHITVAERSAWIAMEKEGY